MKKLLAFVALVAVVAISSVAYAQDTEVLTTSVSLGDSLSIDEAGGGNPCGTAELDDLTGLVGPTTGTDDCSYTITANIDFDHYVEGASSVGLEEGTAADDIDYTTDGADLTTAGLDQAGYYIVNDGLNLSATACGAASDTCTPINTTYSNAWTSETTQVSDEAMTVGLAVSIDVLAPDTYTDNWTLTLAAA